MEDREEKMGSYRGDRHGCIPSSTIQPSTSRERSPFLTILHPLFLYLLSSPLLSSILFPSILYLPSPPPARSSNSISLTDGSARATSPTTPASALP